jgi:hypothetical protein
MPYLESVLAELVVRPALVLVAQHLVSLVDQLKLLLSFG